MKWDICTAESLESTSSFDQVYSATKKTERAVN